MPTPPLIEHFAVLKDPRIDRTKQHLLLDIVVIAFCAVLCGAEGWEDMETFGHAKKEWLQERLGLELPHGVPGDDTFRRLFARLDPEEFGRCFLSFAQSLHTHTQGEVIALDGKTLRHSFDAATGQAAIHLVSAWATGSGLALGQVKVDSKSNEITAIPALLKLLDITGCVITTDAMGCQKAVAKQIIAKGGEYVLALKGNQSNLHEDVKLFFEDARAHTFYHKDAERRVAHRYYETTEKDHGRIETRRCWLVSTGALDFLRGQEGWAGLKSIGAVESERRVASSVGERVTKETRYFLSSLEGSARKFAQAVRAHWGIENRLHWVLDVAFDEDRCGIWQDHAPENLATVRKVALTLLRQDKKKAGIKAKSKLAGWDSDYLLHVLITPPKPTN